MVPLAQCRARRLSRGSDLIRHCPTNQILAFTPLKQAVTRKEPARSKAQLKRAVIAHMRKLSKSPHRVRSVFSHKTFCYAA